MKKYLLVHLILVLSFDLFAKNNEFVYCIKSASVKATKMHPPVRLEDFVNNKKESLFLRMPVNCKNGNYLIPKSKSESIKSLDIMLPIEFKSALLKEKSLRSVYLHSPYGVSIVYDLYHFLEKEWKFDKNRARICKECKKNITNIECYFQLLQELVNQYKNKK